ncbi:MAG: DNA repair protein RadC [Planctomycetes bacterium]|nr:DNA repair protein RadC [Planctomycetota bacterium]
MSAPLETVALVIVPVVEPAPPGLDESIGEGGPPIAEVRPRERLLASGAAMLSTAELVALLLGTGTPGRPATSVASELLASSGGLRRLAARTPAEIASTPGLGAARAARILAAIELGRRSAAEPLFRGAPFRGSADVFRHYHAAMRDLRVEQFRIVLVDGKHRVLREELVSQGTLTSSPVHPREVFAPAIRHGAAGVVLVHNHPSGDPSPSADDLEITRRLVSVGELVGIRVLDHVIVGDGAFASLADRGLM